MSLDDVLKKMDTMIELRNLSNKTKLDYLRKTKQLYTGAKVKESCLKIYRTRIFTS